MRASRKRTPASRSSRAAVVPALSRTRLESVLSPLVAALPDPIRSGATAVEHPVGFEGVESIVVVGAGLAGMHTVQELREQGYEGELVLLGAERRPPYDRPPLSKAVLLGKLDDSALPFDADALRVDLRLGVTATGLAEGVVRTDHGDLRYDGLVIATGSEPVRLPGEGARYLRSHEDALALRAALGAGGRVIVVGAGWIGAEVATAAAGYGCAVSVIEQAPAPVAHVLPAEVGGRMTRWYEQAGVDLRLEERVERVRPDGVELTGGGLLAADHVVVGVGVRPATDWLSGAVELDRGVVTGADLSTSLPRVYAVGDAVARWSPRYGRRIRGEHWDDALRAPAVAAANLLADQASGGAGPTGDQTARRTYDPVPYVWSEQFGRMVMHAGVVPDEARLVWREDGETWAVYWLDAGDRIAALLAVGRPRDFVQGRRLAEAGTPVDPDRLTDTRLQVKQAVAG